VAPVLMSPRSPENFFNALAGATVTDTKSSGYAVPKRENQADGTRTAVWEIMYATGVPTAADFQLQGAMTDTEAEYTVLDETTAVVSEARTVQIGAWRWLRVRQVSRTQNTETSVTVRVTIS